MNCTENNKSNNVCADISIIVSVYNVENYIGKCLSSIISQLDDKVELIIIDDGSTDNSYTICNEIVKNNGFNIRLLTQENQGLSATRNKGIDLSSGKYIMFVDSDDELRENTLSELENKIVNFPEVDIFYYDAKVVDELGNQNVNSYNRINKVPGNIIIKSDEYFEKYYVHTMIVSACLYLFKKEVLKEEIYFDAGRLYEDNLFTYKLLMNSKNVSYIPKQLYVRRYREGSITTSALQGKNIEDLIYISNRILDDYKSNSKINKNEIFNAYLALCYFYYRRVESELLKTEYNTKSFKETTHKFAELLKNNNKTDSLTYYIILRKICENEKEYNHIDCNTDEIKKTVSKKYTDLCDIIKSNKGRRIGVYGEGLHTKLLLNCYKRFVGESLTVAAYINSTSESHIRDNGESVVNIKEAAKYVDVVIISSYVHRLDMIHCCNKFIPDIELIDLYKYEKISLFDKDTNFVNF